MIVRPSLHSHPACASFYHQNSETQVIVVRKLWQEARAIAGLGPVADEQLIARQRVMLKFFTFPFECSHYLFCGRTPFTYMQVWKSANNFIEGNLHRACNRKKEGWWAEAKENSVCAATPATRAFTFVRNPFAHFVSGYVDATFRTYTVCCRNNSKDAVGELHQWSLVCGKMNEFACAPVGDTGQASIGLAAEFMTAFLDADINLLMSRRHVAVMPQHMYLQAGILRRFPKKNATFVGHIESFKRDWDFGLTSLGLPRYAALNKNIGEHSDTSNDILRRRTALLAYLN